MASITISSCMISVPVAQRDNVFTASANINYSCSATLTQSQSTESTYSKTTYSYSELSYAWVIGSVNASGASGSLLVSGLTPKSSNTISGSVTVSCTETVTSYSREDVYVDGDPIYDLNNPILGEPDEYGNAEIIGYPILGYEQVWAGYTDWSVTSTSTNTISASSSTSTTVYTRPGIFTEYNFTADTIIESADGLTATKVSHWIDHCNAFAHWYNQNDTNVTTSACGATTGDVITAAWYNACVAACPDVTTRPAAVTGGIDGTILSASIFSSLGAAISKGDI